MPLPLEQLAPNGPFHRPGPPLCRHCDYPLRNLELPRCPECGQPFDLNDPNTLNTGRSLGVLPRWLLGPASWPTAVAFLVPLSLLFRNALDPEGYYPPPAIQALAITVALAFVLFLRQILRVQISRCYRQAFPQSQFRDRRLRFLLTVTALALFAHITALPLCIAFRFARADLTAIAQEALDGAAPISSTTLGKATRPTFLAPFPTRRAGRFHIVRASLSSETGGVLLYTSPGAGFAYRRPPPYYNEGSSGPVAHDWHWFTED